MLQRREACEYSAAISWAKEDPSSQQRSKWGDKHECWAQEVAPSGKDGTLSNTGG